MLAEPGAIAAVLENAGLEPENVPAALAIADRLRDDLGRDAARGEALAVVVNRIELSPIRLRVILSAADECPPHSFSIRFGCLAAMTIPQNTRFFSIISTSGSAPSSIGRSKSSGRICGSMPPTY